MTFAGHHLTRNRDRPAVFLIQERPTSPPETPRKTTHISKRSCCNVHNSPTNVTYFIYITQKNSPESIRHTPHYLPRQPVKTSYACHSI